ncbi:protein-tyrosine sulfotransferase 1 isoform X1 [Dermochelys coriacea]|nr:protein-tyrosine sulfotransferase 1 isoform X1 [Dermochelys coriacea]XP_043355512.1 protein-tyrosine sulfotransferase 1 isoform X1 [Dermochelys coriacea]XP_043355513.1 protein-tyrosine sulfotransferase 1 isoform X1 [Dermochelys coriacea]XP_043355514.1 protein-tyrosine sulfotransferase 1 isoform X1 [Dermochelys coriacea]XP_043355515.1 protein-tyrosine sulfotransferase 1 isoform X1 [Dermochelys coriacea]
MVGKLKQNLLLACLVISSVTVFYLGQHAMECHHRIEERSQPVRMESGRTTIRTVFNLKANKTFAYNKDMPLIFIGGVPRSGTTLMRAMLDAHPDIRCGEETRVIPRILAVKQMWARSSKEKIRLDEAGVTDEVLDSAMQAFLLEIIVKHGEPAPYLCNKDPFALKSLTYLARIFPNAKFLLMVRDGRASVHSMISRKVTIAGFDLNSYRDCLTKWNRAIETMYNQCMEVGFERCMLVHYEQLVLHPERWMRTLLKFLHIPWNQAVLHHEEMIGKAGGVSLSKSIKVNFSFLIFLKKCHRQNQWSRISDGLTLHISIATAVCPADLVTRARGMVVVTGQNKASGNLDDAMSSSDAEDDFQDPATPTATQAGHSLPLLPQQFPEVVPLNVGGMYFSTRLSTLRRCEDTMLAAMFSGRHYIPTDAQGRYFIDRDGTYFGDILNFLRSGDLPPRERVRSVYKEAQYYSIGPLLDNLEEVQPLKGEKVRQAFLGLMPYYKEHLERIIEIAKLRAMQRKARFAKLKICVFKEEMPITPYECPLFNSLRFERSESETKLFEHHCEVDVSFGPWEAVADVYDLLHCIVTDLSDKGIAVDHQCIGVCDKHLINHYYCKRPIYEFKITWW